MTVLMLATQAALSRDAWSALATHELEDALFADDS